MRVPWIAALGMIALIASCGGPPPAPAPPRPATPMPTVPSVPGRPTAPGKPAAAPVAMPKEPEVKPLPPMAYRAKQRRDPFASLAAAAGAKGLTVASLKLVGILEGRQERLALVEAPDGLGYILRSGDQIGDGRVVEIGRNSLTLSVSPAPGVPVTSMVKRLGTQ